MTEPAEDKLLRMASQITRQLRSMPEEEAVAEIAAHLAAFWTPKMRADLRARLEATDAAIDPRLRRAVAGTPS